jgi:hypothetical protein
MIEAVLNASTHCRPASFNYTKLCCSVQALKRSLVTGVVRRGMCHMGHVLQHSMPRSWSMCHNTRDLLDKLPKIRHTTQHRLHQQTLYYDFVVRLGGLSIKNNQNCNVFAHLLSEWHLLRVTLSDHSLIDGRNYIRSGWVIWERFCLVETPSKRQIWVMW